MPKLRTLSGSDLIRTFARFGFQEISQRGSHVKLRRALVNGVRENLTVPLHDELDRGTLQAIYRQESRYTAPDEPAGSRLAGETACPTTPTTHTHHTHTRIYSLRVRICWSPSLVDRPGGLSYSSRSATMGSSFDARRAGRKLAAVAISASSSAAPASVSGS